MDEVSLEPDCDFVQYEEAIYYASRNLSNRVQKPTGVCHTDAGISGPGSSMILTCKTDNSGVEIDYYDNQECSGTPSKTGTLAELMVELGYFYYVKMHMFLDETDDVYTNILHRYIRR